VHLGVILPNTGTSPPPTPAGVRMVAEAAEELGFDSVWVSEHIIVGPEAVDPFGQVLEPFATLAWIAGFTERIQLGTSITLVPLHQPVRLAKEAATLQLLSGGRFLLGVGLGWHEDEFRFLGVDFRHRGRRTDESLRLLRALWSGAGEFHGEWSSFEAATFGPLPDEPPEVWVAGGTDRSIRRTRELGDVWHPSRAGTPERIREVKERFPDLRVIPRASGANLERRDELIAAGCEGIVAGFDGGPAEIVAAMRDLARERAEA
jgi:probable F420-dependent oxidoreductase